MAMIIISLFFKSPGSWDVNSIKEAIKHAAAGIGSPLKWLICTLLFSTLNLASRNAPHMTYIKAANQPKRPNGSSAHKNARVAGATPKATRSDRESYSIPKWLVVWVKRAIRPSRPSNIADIMIAIAAASYLPCIDAMMA